MKSAEEIAEKWIIKYISPEELDDGFVPRSKYIETLAGVIREYQEQSKKDQTHFNGLTPAEAERLSCLLEEMGESLQIIGKIQRHGYESYNPITEGESNRLLLEKEIGHVSYAMRAMFSNNDISGLEAMRQTNIKEKDIKKWLHHQDEK